MYIHTDPDTHSPETRDKIIIINIIHTIDPPDLQPLIHNSIRIIHTKTLYCDCNSYHMPTRVAQELFHYVYRQEEHV